MQATEAHSTAASPAQQGGSASPAQSGQKWADPGFAVQPVADPMAGEAFVLEQFIELWLAQSKRAQIGQFGGAAVITYLWLQAGSQWAAWSWLGLALLVFIWRWLKTESFVRNAATGSKAARRIALAMALNGLVLAIPMFSFAEFSAAGRAAFTTIVLVLATGAVVTTAGYRGLFFAYALPMFVPLALAWALLPASSAEGSAAYAMPVLMLLFLGVMQGVSKQAFAVFDESCRIRFRERDRNAQLAKALADADEANRAKTQFLAAASHDLRQPIHSLNVLVAALAARPLDASSKEIVDLLGSVNQALSAELETLLEISKLDAGIVKPTWAAVNVLELLNGHQATVAPLALAAGIDLRVLASPQVAAGVLACTDAALLARVLGNLTGNALKFTPAGGHIELLASIEAGKALITVADSGVGIAPHEQQRVFQEFYQVENPQRDRSRGLGLGLSIVKRSCELLGIALELESAMGQGTRVRLRVPLAPPDALPATTAPATEPAPLPTGLRVLVVDDEPQVRQAMRLLLTQWRCHVFEADSTAQALQVASHEPLALALCDLRLREHDSGLATVAALRAKHPDLALALTTGDTAPNRIAQAREAGVPLLHKPVPLGALQTLLAQAAGKTQNTSSTP